MRIGATASFTYKSNTLTVNKMNCHIIGSEPIVPKKQDVGEGMPLRSSESICILLRETTFTLRPAFGCLRPSANKKHIRTNVNSKNYKWCFIQRQFTYLHLWVVLFKRRLKRLNLLKFSLKDVFTHLHILPCPPRQWLKQKHLHRCCSNCGRGVLSGSDLGILALF